MVTENVHDWIAEESWMFGFIYLFVMFQNAMLPAGFRQRDQTKKSPTGPFDRNALLDHLEKQALEHQDREDLVPFTGEKKGSLPATSAKREE